jgi:hypothetical protein
MAQHFHHLQAGQIRGFHNEAEEAVWLRVALPRVLPSHKQFLSPPRPLGQRKINLKTNLQRLQTTSRDQM